jgi:hypothetical protein
MYTNWKDFQSWFTNEKAVVNDEWRKIRKYYSTICKSAIFLACT